MGSGGSVSALWQAFASCGRTCGTACDSVSRDKQAMERQSFAYRHCDVLRGCLWVVVACGR